MDRLRKKIDPRRWRMLAWLCLGAAVSMLVLGNFFAGNVLLSRGGLLLLPAFWGTLIIWQCLSCGVLLPTRLIGCTAGHCPYCGRRVDQSPGDCRKER